MAYTRFKLQREWPQSCQNKNGGRRPPFVNHPQRQVEFVTAD